MIHYTKTIKNEQGQAMIEFCLIIPLFVICMIFLLFIYNLVSQIIRVQQDVCYELRVTIEEEWQDDFHAVEEKRDVFVAVPSKIKEMIGKAYVSKEIMMSAYAGCYPDLKKNEYRRRYRYRQIE